MLSAALYQNDPLFANEHAKIWITQLVYTAFGDDVYLCIVVPHETHTHIHTEHESHANSFQAMVNVYNL